MADTACFADHLGVGVGLGGLRRASPWWAPERNDPFITNNSAPGSDGAAFRSGGTNMFL